MLQSRKVDTKNVKQLLLWISGLSAMGAHVNVVQFQMQKMIAMRATNLLNHPHDGAHDKHKRYRNQKEICIGRIIGHAHRLRTPIENHKTNEQNEIANQTVYFRVLHVQNIKIRRPPSRMTLL